MPSRFLGRSLVVVATFVVVLAALLFWRLSAGPVRLDFLAATLADALSQPDQGFVVGFSGLVLDADEGLVLTAEGARVVSPDGTILASSPEVRLGISRQALLQGVLAPSSVDLAGVRVRLYRTADGSLRFTLANSRSDPASSGSKDPEFDVSDFLRPPDPAKSTGYLRRLRVTDGAVVLIDERSGTIWRAPGADFSIARDQEKITAGLRVTIDAPGGEQRLDASGGLDLATREAWLELRVGGLRLARLAPLVPALEQARAVDMAFDATASARFDAEGDLKQGRFQADGSEGTVSLGGAGAVPIPLRRARISGALDAEADRITIDDFMVMLGDSVADAKASVAFVGDRIQIDGDIRKLDVAAVTAAVPSAGDTLRSDGALQGGFAAVLSRDGNLDRLEFTLKGSEGSLQVASEPMPLDQLSVAGTVEGIPDGLRVPRLILDLGGPTVEASGQLVAHDESWEIDGEVVARDIAVDALNRLWPEGLVAGGRRWITENLADGRVSEARLVLSTVTGSTGTTEEAEEISGSLAFEGVTARYWQPLPPFQDVSGAATFAGRTFDVRLEEGHLGNIELANGRVLLKGLGLEAGKETADVDVAVTGPLAEILTVLDNPPLGYAKWLKLDPAQVGGRASAKLAVELPLLDDLSIDDVEIAASADLAEVTIPGVVLGRDLEGAKLALDVDKTKLDLSGEGRLAGAPVRLDVTEVFAGEDAGSRIRVSGVLSDKVLADFEAPVGDYVTGPVPVQLTMTGRADGGRIIEAGFDLQRAKLALPPVDWSKPAGTPGTAAVRLRMEGDRLLAVDRFEVNAGTGYATGRASLKEQGAGLERVELDRLRLGERTDLKVTMEVADDGTRTVHLAGASVDLAPLLRQVDQPGDGGGADQGDHGDVLIDARLRQVWIGARYPLLDVDGHLMFDGAALRGGEARGEVGEGNVAHLVVGETNGERRLQLTLDDTGAALRTLGWVDSLSGGSLQINAARAIGPAAAPWSGKAETGTFRISGAPLAARLLAAASLTGIADLSSRDAGITFDRLEAPFSLGDGRLKLEPGRAYGGALGVTFFGSVDTQADAIDIAGTIVPAYALNSVLGSIPLLGTLLTGEEGSGLFAATYRASGPIDEPEISVNPLAALAPGFLRNLFGEIAGGGGAGEREAATDPAAERFPGNLN